MTCYVVCQEEEVSVRMFRGENRADVFATLPRSPCWEVGVGGGA
jgi:hypothetical protein